MKLVIMRLTAAHLNPVLAEQPIWILFNARVYGTNNSFINGILANQSFLFILAVILSGQVLATQFGGDIFRTVPLSLCEWLTIAAVTCPVLIIGEIVRLIGRYRS